MNRQKLTTEQFFARLFRNEDRLEARSREAMSRHHFGSKEHYASLFGDDPESHADKLEKRGAGGFGAPGTGVGAADERFGAPGAGFGAPGKESRAPNVGFDTRGKGFGTPGAGVGATDAGYGNEKHLTEVAAHGIDTGPLRVTIQRRTDGRIIRKVEADSHGSGETSFDYAYDEAGRLTLVLRDGVEVERYEYDEAGRRIAGASEAFGMQPVTLEYDRMRLTRCGDTSYGYASDGTLRDRHDASGSTWFLYAGDTGLDRAVLPDGRIFSWQTNNTTGQPLVKYEGDTPVERYVWRDLMSLERYDDLRQGISQQYHYAEGSSLPTP